MKRILIVVILIVPFTMYAQTILKVGGSLSNRWSETLNSQTIGKGFSLSIEKPIVKPLSFGIVISSNFFSPNTFVKLRFANLGLISTYYFGSKNWMPFLGLGIGYTNYHDKTSIDIGNGFMSVQERNKSYGNISPFLGLTYRSSASRIGFFMQVNADFIPVVNIAPIGFVSTTAGLSFKLKK